MRILLLLTILLHFNITLSQQNNSINSAEAEYTCFIDSDMPTSLYTTLYINNNVSIFKEKTSTATRGQLKGDDGSSTTIGPSIIFEPYLKIDRNKKTLQFFDMIGSNTFLIEDQYPQLNWTITEEVKLIAGFSCNKALADYRGRKWIAWFTTEIPLSFGPWKLHGLPGLILEATDSTNKYTWKAVKVTYTKSKLFDTEFASLITSKNTKPISYQQFLSDTKEYGDNVFAEISKNNSSGTLTRQHVPRKGKELVFEWE